MSPRHLVRGALVAIGGVLQIVAGWPAWIPVGVFVIYLALAAYTIHLRRENERHGP